MERQIFLLLIIMGGVWLVVDDLAGKHYLTRFIQGAF